MNIHTDFALANMAGGETLVLGKSSDAPGKFRTEKRKHYERNDLKYEADEHDVISNA
jgi:hypothetical protein